MCVCVFTGIHFLFLLIFFSHFFFFGCFVASPFSCLPLNFTYPQLLFFNAFLRKIRNSISGQIKSYGASADAI